MEALRRAGTTVCEPVLAITSSFPRRARDRFMSPWPTWTAVPSVPDIRGPRVHARC